MTSGSRTSGMVYTRNLVRAGVGGAGAAWKGTGSRVTARSCLAPTLIGAALAALTVTGAGKRKGRHFAIAGLAGSLIGLGGGAAWAVRNAAGAAAKRAARDVAAVRDARWLEKNPVAYA